MAEIMPQTRYQNIDDVELQYLDYDGGEPAIILLHATGFLPWLWHPIARQLAGLHRVVAPYFCDHRVADIDDGGLHWLTLAQDMARFSDELNIQHPILVGHSMGGTVMTLAEAKFNLGAAGLILIEPIFFPENYYRTQFQLEDYPLVHKAMRRRNQWENTASVKDYLQSKSLFAKWDEEFIDLYIQHGTVQSPDFGLELTCPPPREAALFMGAIQYDPWPMLPKVRCPVLVLEGARSTNRGYIDLEKAAAEFPNGQFQRIAEAGHLVVMEKPSEIQRAIKDFIASINATDR